jgi:hypothetical protein
MADEQNSGARHADRYSHITIGLRYREAEAAPWQSIRALGWNDVGFNFYSNVEIEQPELTFNRSAVSFAGVIVWTAGNVADDAILDAIVNELIYKQAGNVVHNSQLHGRLVRLIRTPHKEFEKRAVLTSLGVNVSDEKLAEIIAGRKQGRPMFQYGVKLESEAWNTIVEGALRISGGLIELEKMSKALTPRRTPGPAAS